MTKKQLSNREQRRLSKWKFAKELECLDLFLRCKCVKQSQGMQSRRIRGSGSNGKLYDVPVAPGQWFGRYKELVEQLPLNVPIDENRLKTLLNTLCDPTCTKFNIQDVLPYHKGCTKINVQGVPNLGIMISLENITDRALFEELEKDPNYVQNLIFGCTKINVRAVQNSICINTNNISTKEESTIKVSSNFPENSLSLLFGNNCLIKDTFKKEFFNDISDWKNYKELPFNDQVFIYNIWHKFGIDFGCADLNTFKYTDYIKLISQFENVPLGKLTATISKGFKDILSMASRGELEYINRLDKWLKKRIENTLQETIENESLPF